MQNFQHVFLSLFHIRFLLPLAAGAPSLSGIQMTERKGAEFYSLDTLEGSEVKPLLTCRRVVGQ
jgi:hypothetical protein